MSNAHVGPSGLHLKKELTALRKARFLRDPETSSSWRSPLSNGSLAARYGWNHVNGTAGTKEAQNLELDSSLPLRSESNQKKVFLYNWRNQSAMSSDSGLKLERDIRPGSVPASPEDSLSDAQKGDSRSDTYLEDPIVVYRAREANGALPAKRMTRKLKKTTTSKQRFIRNSIISKQLDLPSSSMGVLSVGLSDDTEYGNSEDLQLSVQKFGLKTGYTSRSASPLLSGYENWSYSSKILKKARQTESSYSYTPASTSSFNRYGDRYPSTVGSWDGTTSFDEDDLDHVDLPRSTGCGIPCYWSRKTKHRGCGGCYSPSFSDTLRRKGSSIFCGGQSLYHKPRPSSSYRQKHFSKTSTSLPLLTNSQDGAGSSVETVSDELSTNYGELDLEASSRLDGRRWSSCRSQEGLELALTTGADEAADNRSLSQKYRPRTFDELVGQNIAVQSLHNAILRGRIATVYLFQGPRGTGKTSTARIFAGALNCLSTEETKPCGRCRLCIDCISGKSINVREVDATNKSGLDKVRHILKKLSVTPPFSHYKVFIINECHMLPSKAWSAFLKFLEDPPSRVVFVFVTIDPDSLPRTVLSRCQRYLFPKIKDVDIVTRLKKLSAAENLDIEADALDLIALNSDGSLRDAEMMLEQLSLLGKRITTSLVNDLVGVVSDEKLLDLLELAMSSETAETVKRARELMNSGVDPMALMSQLAGLIMDIIAGTYRLVDSKCGGSSFGGRSLTEVELERLKQALKILSEAEKQLRVSSERSTWFTAALLQLGSGCSPAPTYSSRNSKLTKKKLQDDSLDIGADILANGKKVDASNTLWKSRSASMLRTVNSDCSPLVDLTSSRSMAEHFSLNSLPPSGQSPEGTALHSTHKETVVGNMGIGCVNPIKLEEIWRCCIERCHSKTLKQLLYDHGKLVSISEDEDVFIVCIAFGNRDIKSRAERFLSSITNSFETVLRHDVEVRIGLLQNWESSTNPSKQAELQPESIEQKPMQMVEMMDKEGKEVCNELNNPDDQVSHKELLRLHRKSFSSSEVLLRRTLESCNGSLVHDEGFQSATALSADRNNVVSTTKERSQEMPFQTIRSAIDEQRLENAWLQATEKGTPGSFGRSKPERNQVLPQDGVSHQDETASAMAVSVSSKHWEDELNHDIKSLKINQCRDQEDQSCKRADHYAMSPSLLHSNTFAASFDKENL
ncbi:hypothetical protein ACLOJK_014118 [Asimina triloba]